jgi:hypothetical protein
MPDQHQHIVQAVFKPGGRLYHYTCPGAEIGDIIQAEGNNPAMVVAYGRDGYWGVCRGARIIEKASYNNGHHHKETSMNTIYKSSVEDLADQLAAAKKAAKRAARVEAAKKAELKERNRLRRVALCALEDVARGDCMPDRGDQRIAAAVELLVVTR